MSNPLAIVIGFAVGFAVFGILLLIGARFIGESVWTVLIAFGTVLAGVGTVGAVLVALFYPLILKRWQRPILEIGFFESAPPHLRQTPGTVIQTGEVIGILYPLSIRLRNTGKTIARNAQPLVTGMSRLVDGNWRIQGNWIAAPIRWGLDEFAVLSTGRPTEEKDLIPERPYFFNLGLLGTDDPNRFRLNPISMPGGQEVRYDPGEFCFELTAFAEGAEPAKSYFHIQWDGGCTEDFDDVLTRITVNLRDRPPW